MRVTVTVDLDNEELARVLAEAGTWGLAAPEDSHQRIVRDWVLSLVENRLEDLRVNPPAQDVQEDVAICTQCGDRERAGLVDAQGRCEECAREERANG